MRKTTILILAVLLASAGRTFAQDNKEVAQQKLRLAVELMDQGVYDESIALLDEAEALDPGSYAYSYEKAFAYYLQQDYPAAIKLLKKSLKHPDASDQVYQLLGNAYDMDGNPKKALDTYTKGMKKFPGSGKLYLESGIIFFNQGIYSTALKCFNIGIDVDPGFPSNYYHAAYLYLNSENKAYGMMLGETFMNLERNTDRTNRMSELLYAGYKDNIAFPNDSTATVSFSDNVINLPDIDSNSFSPGDLLTFPIAYEMALLPAVGGETEPLTISSICDIRCRFLDNWFGGDLDYGEIHHTPVFDYQRRIIEAGHFEAYTYWLLSEGDPEEFNEWYIFNEEAYTAFADWFNNNPITME